MVIKYLNKRIFCCTKETSDSKIEIAEDKVAINNKKKKAMAKTAQIADLTTACLFANKNRISSSLPYLKIR